MTWLDWMAVLAALALITGLVIETCYHDDPCEEA